MLQDNAPALVEHHHAVKREVRFRARLPSETRTWNATMRLKVLPMFLDLCETGSFTATSARLSISQPLLSKHISSLETDVGAELFYRDGRGIILTEAGKIFQDYATRVVAASAEAMNSISALREAPSMQLVIGMTPSISTILQCATRSLSSRPPARRIPRHVRGCQRRRP